MTREGNDFSKYLKFSDRDNAPTFYSHMAKVVDGVKQEKLGFLYHHTTENLEVSLLGELRIGHTMLLTKEKWLLING